MNIWDLCIRRPVFTVMLVSAPLALGLMSYRRLGVDLFPNVELPIVTVTTTLRGASVEEMETSVTKPLEEIINTISLIDELRSTTREGFSQIRVQFFLEKDREVAAQEVRDKVSTIVSRLPVGTDMPIIDKFDLDAVPVVTIAVAGNRPLQEITEIARKRIKEQLESLNGVGAVIIVGGRQRAINVIVDTDLLTAYNLSIEEVRQALMRQNIELPGGRVDQGTQELVLRTMARMETAAEFAKLIVADRNGYPVRISDIGRVEDSSEEPRGVSRLDGRNAVSLVVQKQSGVNTVAVVDAVKRRLEELLPTLPPDLRTFIVRDQSRFIKRSMQEVQFHLVIAAVLVGGTIVLFIRDWRTTIIATLSIPASIIATFAYMEYMGFTLNNFTMLGLIMAVGIVIDDAVVIHENIFRHMEEHGRPAREAASTATKEIALAVMATTMSLLVIFIPIIFMQGRVGRFFSCFGSTVAFAIFMSLCVSFTMTPMLCSRFLVLRPGHKASKSGPAWRAIEGFYGACLRWSLRHRWAIVVISVATLSSTFPLWRSIGRDFIPRDDQSEFEVAITLPEGYSLERADQTFQEVEAELRKLPGVLNLFTVIGDTSGRMVRGQGDVTTGSVYVRLVDLEERQPGWFDLGYWWAVLTGRKHTLSERYYSQFDVMRQAREMIRRQFPDFQRISVQDVSSFGGGGGRNVALEMNVRGPDLQKLENYSRRITAWMRGDLIQMAMAIERDRNPLLSPEELTQLVTRNLQANPQYYGQFPQESPFLDVDTSLSLRKPELRVHIDRERASDVGIPAQTIAATLNVLVGGEPVSTYKEGDEQYDVWLRADVPFRDRPESISRLMVPSQKAGLVQLGGLASLQSAEGPNTINRFGMQRQVVISSNLEVNYPLQKAVEQLRQYVISMGLPPEYRFEFLGRAKSLAEADRNFLIAFLLSALFMYMILAAQFESFIHPVTILLALPLTVPFALASLLLMGTNLNNYAMIGMFMLFGIVKKNGILQVDYTNVLRAKGVPREEAIIAANHVRLRPILMTTVMLIAAMIPIATGTGPGSGSRASLAKVILGGQTLSLLLTLLVTPVAYSLWDDLGAVVGRLIARWRWRPRSIDLAGAAAEKRPV